MSKSLSPSALDGQQLAERNDVAVLARLHQYGHLRRVEIGRAVWPQSPASSGYSMAGRTLRRLRSRFYVMAKPNAIGSDSFVLTERGAARLKVEGIEARAGTELATAGSRFVHHTIGARYLIERAASGGTVWSEQDVDASRAPVGRGELKQRWGKVPDGLSLSRSIPGAIDWIEVEGSKKAGDDVGRILSMSRDAGHLLGGERSPRIGQIVVVYDRRPECGHEAALVAGLSRMRAKLSEQEMRRALDALVFVRCEIANPLVWKSREEVSAMTILALAKSPRVQRAKPAASAPAKERPLMRHWQTGEPLGPPSGATPAELEEWERWEREEQAMQDEQAEKQRLALIDLRAEQKRERERLEAERERKKLEALPE
jgi:hypothetical protein